MNRSSRFILATALSVLFMLFASSISRASGGGDESPPEFNSPWGPVRPLSELATGSLGVVEGSWWRKPLLLAWYRLNGENLPAGALEAFQYGDRLGKASDVTLAIQAWLTEANAVAPDLAPNIRLWATSDLPAGNRWDSFLNCPNAAWEQARKTLADRIIKWGSSTPATRDWIAAQHRVFARCPLGPSHYREDLHPEQRMSMERAQRHFLPEMNLADPPPGAPLLLAQDRAYQRAAALLYEGHYAEAEAAFSAIAQDTASPWREWGEYEALRARFRALQVTPSAYSPNDACEAPECVKAREDYLTLRQREAARLRADLNRALDSARESGGGGPDEIGRLRDLYSLVAARLDPSLRFRELAAELKRPGIDAPSFQKAAVDYLHLHRQFPPSEPLGEWLSGLIDGRDPSGTSCKTGATPGKIIRGTLTQEEEFCLRLQWSQESLERFQSQPRQHAWLFSAAVLAERGDPHLKTLLKALSDVPENHPGATTFMLHRLRLSSRDEALPLAAVLMKRPDVLADYSARNRVREYRLLHASNLEEFWADGLREAGTAFDRDTLLQSAPVYPSTPPILGWDIDTKWILNYEFPHAALMETAIRSGWPAHERGVVANMAWVRAQLRKDAVSAREAVAVMVKLEFQEDQMKRLLAIKDDRAFLLESGVIAQGAKIDGTCHLAAPKSDAYTPDYEEPVGNLKQQLGQFAKRILSIKEYEAWRQERDAFDALPDLTSVWMQNVLDFAEHFPADARVPGLLRDAVYSTHLNWCADESAGQLSKKAFELLKRKYPKSEAARLTKYWFKPKS